MRMTVTLLYLHAGINIHIALYKMQLEFLYNIFQKVQVS